MLHFSVAHIFNLISALSIGKYIVRFARYILLNRKSSSGTRGNDLFVDREYKKNYLNSEASESTANRILVWILVEGIAFHEWSILTLKQYRNVGNWLEMAQLSLNIKMFLRSALDVTMLTVIVKIMFRYSISQVKLSK